MATRFYFPSAVTQDITVNPAPSSSDWGSTSGFQRRKLNTSKIGEAFGNSAAGTLPNTAGTAAAGANALCRQYVSAPLAAQTISTSATLSSQCMVREANASHNIDAARVSVYVVTGDGSAVRGVLLSAGQYGTTGNEWSAGGSTASRNCKVILGGTAVQNTISVQDGDCLVFEIGPYTSVGGTGTPNGTVRVGDNNTADLPVNDTQTTDGAGWFEISSNLTFSTAKPSLVNIIGTFEGTTSVTATYPGAITSGNLLLLAIASKYPNNVPDTPSGWTALPQASGGAGSAGVDTGSVYSTVFYKVADGTETGNFSVTIPSGNSAIASILQFARSTSQDWRITTTTASSNSGGTSWSATGASDLSLVAGDILIAASAINTDTVRFSGHSLSATGCTFEQIYERADFGTTLGDDCATLVTFARVATGPSSAAPVFTSTGDSGTPSGATLFIRLHEATITGSASNTLGSLTSSSTATTTVTGSVSKTLGSLTSSSTVSTTVTGSLTGTLGGLTLSSVGSYTGTVSAVLGITADLFGGLQFIGSASSVLPSVSLSSAGTQQFVGTCGAVLKRVTVSASGTHANTYTGSVAAVLVRPAVVATGSEVFTGAVSVTAPSSVLSAVGSEVFTGSVTAVVTPQGVSASGNIVPLAIFGTVGTSFYLTVASIGWESISGAVAAHMPAIRVRAMPRTTASRVLSEPITGVIISTPITATIT